MTTEPENRQLRAVFILVGGAVLCAGLAIYGLLHVFGIT